ncbi:MAG: hypothetical protein D6799_02100, partial [Bacteroidetes bacterium]
SLQKEWQNTEKQLQQKFETPPHKYNNKLNNSKKKSLKSTKNLTSRKMPSMAFSKKIFPTGISPSEKS